MVEFEFGSDYLTVDSTKDGDIAVILTEGELGEITYQGKTKPVINIDVEVSGKKMVFTPAMKAGRALQEAFGMDTKDWIGEKFAILHIDKKLVIRPVSEVKV